MQLGKLAEKLMPLLSNSISAFQVMSRHKWTQSPITNRKTVQFPQVSDLLAESISQEYAKPISILVTRPKPANCGTYGFRKSVICKCYQIPTHFSCPSDSENLLGRLHQLPQICNFCNLPFDTGASISILQPTIVNDIILDSTPVSISSASGEKIICHGQQSLKVTKDD